MKPHLPAVASGTQSDIGPRNYRLECSDPLHPQFVNFYEPEEHNGVAFRWSKSVAMIRLEIPVDDYHVTLETLGLRGPNSHFELYWNDHPIPAREIAFEFGQLKFNVSQKWFVSDRDQRLTLTCKPLTVEKGRRQLGLPLAWLELTQVGEATPALPLQTKSIRNWNTPSNQRIKRLFGQKVPEPRLPIWKIEMPSLPALSTSQSSSPTGGHADYESAVICAVEINDRHGTGLLIKYLFQDFSNMATAISRRCYDGDRVRSAIHHELPGGDLTRPQIYQAVLEWFQNRPPKQAYVVPYFESDLIIGMALKDLFQTKICLHIMDDNCLYSDSISASIIEEAINKSDVCFAISPEMRAAYEEHFGIKIWLLPPIVPDHLIARDQINRPADVSHDAVSEPWHANLLDYFRTKFRRTREQQYPSSPDRGILIGNVWDRSWLELLRKTIRESGLELDWYSNNPAAVWLGQDSIRDLDQDGIHLHDALWGQDLVDELRRRPFAVMPSGRLASGESRESIARLSLPSRIPFVVSTSQLPVIVLGSQDTAAAKFIKRFDLGRVVGYDGQAFQQAALELLHPEVQQSVRQRAHKLSPIFSAKGLKSWLWKSVEQERPYDDRFEQAFAWKEGEFAYFLDAKPPRNIHWETRPMWKMLRRLSHQGVQPEMVIDIGSSNGVWSWTAANVFPDAHYVLIDPLMSRYDPDHRQFYLNGIASHEVVQAAISDQSGQAEILVSDDLYGSSLLNINDRIHQAQRTTVKMMTLDELARQKGWSGRTLMKLDVQFAEHLVINGGLEFIQKHVDAMILELTLQREHPEAKTYVEMISMLEDLGYRLVDEMGGWRNPRTGRLEQKDAVFVRADANLVSRVA